MGLESSLHYIPLGFTHCRTIKIRSRRQQESKCSAQSYTCKTQIKPGLLTWRSVLITTMSWIRWIIQGMLPWCRASFYIANLTIILMGNLNPMASTINLCLRSMVNLGMIKVKQKTRIIKLEKHWSHHLQRLWIKCHYTEKKKFSKQKKTKIGCSSIQKNKTRKVWEQHPCWRRTKNIR